MVLWLTAYIIIPLYTVLFVKGSNWFDTNFSVIGNQLGRQGEFVLWGLIVGLYFFWCLRRIAAALPVKIRGTWLIPLSLLLLASALTTPYLPDQLPVKSTLHVIFAFTAAVCLTCCLLLIVRQLCRQDRALYRPYLAGLGAIIAVSAVLFALSGIISSAMEIFFTVASTIMVYRLYRRVT